MKSGNDIIIYMSETNQLNRLNLAPRRGKRQIRFKRTQKKRQRAAGKSNIIQHHIKSNHNIKKELVVETLPQLTAQQPQPKKDPEELKAREQAGKQFNVSGRRGTGHF